jgi:hypothetical protein
MSTTVSSKVNSSCESTMTWTRALIYGFSSVLGLWAWSGGNLDYMWPRQGILAGLLLLMTLIGLRLSNQMSSSQKIDLKDIKKTVTIAVVVAVICILGLLLVQNGIFKPHWNSAIQSAKASKPLMAILGAIAVAYGLESISRGLLAKAWGVGGVAFLDALTAGVGAQHIGVFLGVYLIAFTMGVLLHGFDYVFTIPMTSLGKRVVIRPQVSTLSSVVIGRMLWTSILTAFLVF